MSENITVNGQSLKQYQSEQKSKEIQKFLAEEMRGFRFATSKHFCSKLTRNQSRPIYKESGRVETK